MLEQTFGTQSVKVTITWESNTNVAESNAAILVRHQELTNRLVVAPAARQEAIASELVEMAPRVAEAYRKSGCCLLPKHHGYYRLAVNNEKRGDLQRAISVSREALAAGWKGDWEKRIERCEKKLQTQK